MITSEEMKRRLWDGANELRGSMDASRYKDYMLGLMFYKFLSDKTLETFKLTSGLGEINDSGLVEEYTKAKAEYGEQLEKMIKNVLGYYVLPEYLYQTWLKDINSGDFEVQKITDSLNNFERTIAVSGDSDDFKGLFSSSTLDLTDTALGSNLNERSKNVKALILLFADLNMVALQKGDVLGDAYEYLIGQFAMESGKKAGEFYTPRQVSEVMAQIVARTSEVKSIYDPTVGSGSLLLTVGKHLDEDAQKNLSYYGQEKNTATYNLTRMNLLLHDVRPEKMTIRNGDSLSQDWPEDPERPNEGVQFDAVVMNPPYSVKNWNKSGLKVSDPRFEVAGVLPPDSKGDFAFLLHGLFHLGQNGTMAIVLPHGVLFRGSAEGAIRERLLKKNYIDTIIGLPDHLFTNTGIPVVVMILKKNRKIDEPVLIIDASRGFIKIGKQNVLQEKDIAKIVDTHVERREEEGYSHLATREEIIENQYNMNIPRYIEALSEEIPQDVDAHLLGGIPQKNIDDLKVLQSTAPDVLKQSLKKIRDGYVELVKPVEEISDDILSDARIAQKTKEIESNTKAYMDKYWDILRNADNSSSLTQLMNDMLVEIKEILSAFKYIDVYDGYQVVAEIWKNALTHDTEIIALSDFYTAGRTREPNMVTKGSGNKKREEQDGWVGRIVPNELIAKRLYSHDIEEIESKKTRIQEIENELSDLVSAANVEDSDEENALGETLNKSGEAFESKKVKAELKKPGKGTVEHNLLKKVEKLLADKSALSRAVRADEKALNESVQERILTLTNEEIDRLMHEKWFGSMLDAMFDLVWKPLKAELNTLQLLHNRYADTLSAIDEEIQDSESSLEALMRDLVVRS
ncbi:type I restriction-modification system subunit M [Sporolactobacillus terrae]|uniref:site-specific DNA-methyltransferase (adenine-specific) n=1 Tax=Sporolactobacillus terrae TaxID=269673 RepID=A0ABX5Q947_9BACL|nr:type I restriction-modification system subunit M [Sporolactobacillus terrae]QAA23209.1 type I restriction-modification system subunit M [Sporolactobacillus terrae]QAA26179.1 type I restriction-modification system subunit M [Sporolactobacillus terrae]UAK15276.1 type I restriction-modification system subunit M [Sporolactobacillus terrae]